MSQQNLHPNPQGATTGNTRNQNMNAPKSQNTRTSATAPANRGVQTASQVPQNVSTAPQPPIKGIATFYVQEVDGCLTSIQNLQTSGYCRDEQTYNSLLYVLTPEEFAHLNNNGYFYKLGNHPDAGGRNYLSFALYQLVQQDDLYGYQATVMGTQGKFYSAQELYNNIINQRASLEQRLSSVRQVALKNSSVFSKNVNVVVHSSDQRDITTSLQKILNEELFANTVYFANLDTITNHSDFIVKERNRYLHRQIEELESKVDSYKKQLEEKITQLNNAQIENQKLYQTSQTDKATINELSKQKATAEQEKQTWESKYKKLEKDFYSNLENATVAEKRRLENAVKELRNDFINEVRKIINGIQAEVAQTYNFRLPEPNYKDLQKMVAQELEASKASKSTTETVTGNDQNTVLEEQKIIQLNSSNTNVTVANTSFEKKITNNQNVVNNK